MIEPIFFLNIFHVSIRPLGICDLCYESKCVCIFLNPTSGIRSSTVTLISIYSHKNWMVHVYFCSIHILQSCHVFVCMKWNYSVVMVSCRHEHSWVCLISNIMIRWVLNQVVERSLTIRETVFCLPKMSTGEFMKSKHVSDWNLRDGSSKKLWSKVSCDSNECSSIRTS